MIFRNAKDVICENQGQDPKNLSQALEIAEIFIYLMYLCHEFKIDLF